MGTAQRVYSIELVNFLSKAFVSIY